MKKHLFLILTASLALAAQAQPAFKPTYDFCININVDARIWQKVEKSCNTRHRISTEMMQTAEKACRAAGYQNQGEMKKIAAQKAESIMQALGSSLCQGLDENHQQANKHLWLMKNYLSEKS